MSTKTSHEQAIEEMIAEAGENLAPEDQAFIDELQKEQASVREQVVTRSMGRIAAIDMRDGVVMTQREVEEARRHGNNEGTYKGNRR